MSKWIDVTDRLPNHGEEVWVYDQDEGVLVGTRAYYGWYHVYGDDYLYRVTHWMPMTKPDPPKASEVK